ncbi:hypothetical protein POM88_001842 [Heracleum sosnowskyi]|uniref:Uncharacterized protein n=1 Tax=Heracleum sosnowskyi TaxID=360622 RepID=A0AAD8JGX8_9APIA|nr:hypothetical protein POM88_001842 [Heracleum sosnowskyi]
MFIHGTSYKCNEEENIPGNPGKEGNGKLGMEGSWNGAFSRSRPAMASSMPKNDKAKKIENTMNNLILIVIFFSKSDKKTEEGENVMDTEVFSIARFTELQCINMLSSVSRFGVPNNM